MKVRELDKWAMFLKDNIVGDMKTMRDKIITPIPLLSFAISKKMMQISINTPWDPTNNIEIFSQESWNSDFDRTSNLTLINETQTRGIMIITESWTEGINFERHKEESLISSQFLKNQKKKQNLMFFWFLFNILYYNECMLFIRHD